ncbi:cbb3-type cytochrome oxidase subunit 3 [Aquabacterium sp. OR-4]|uniref:cbb3-type cytochrome oxidase subunit 3 n=1 Tax=Aquabacterium sp. OR-4 TaxID=2978127 RepID=UPI0021B18F0C|nr:cbb3-type cytochrome c oxidase subunit 3 [Aquabacterium sp. OR-4]MDT7835311.1 cbb3-type cytochrome c oxidase subunit 3 [Aquabacterium sp. OR-4]
MELIVLRSAVTLFSFLVFLGIVVWAWKGRRREAFDAAAQLPFIDDEPSGAAQRSQGAKQ